jgi:hypothetical protein
MRTRAWRPSLPSLPSRKRFLIHDGLRQLMAVQVLHHGLCVHHHVRVELAFAVPLPPDPRAGHGTAFPRPFAAPALTARPRSALRRS